MQRGSRRFREFLYKGERGEIINHMVSIFALEEMVLPIIERGWGGAVACISPSLFQGFHI